jgi:hypothetical protein
MTRRGFVFACCVLLSSSASFAQSRESKPTSKTDPVTGAWTGELVRAEGQRIPVTLQLKFDGKKAITGTVSGLPNPADVKAGTLDTKTGALKLELGRADGPAVLLTLEGTLAQGVASGKVLDSGGGTGEFKIAKKP